ncbi:hypothetical protein OKA05_22870 [Luteolibacter arcticus]|uniref:Uncharacterized protein n=1 Tax=Luteolibacter arcticus TaxID=1581411 RepID=A0ABT3GPH6_9BACT|nr:hypothetical protein [Luteolibacter arcticus]MCW1925422.1 hypothetical protein [Luteolibacter arcticus]
MKEGEYYLDIDEALPRVTFDTTSLKGAKAGLAELKRRRKLIVLRKRTELASLRENRSRYTGTREFSRGRGNWLTNLVFSLMRAKAYHATAEDDFQIAHLDRLLISIDRVILDIENKISALKP